MGQYHFMLRFVNVELLPKWLYLLIYTLGRLSAPFFLLISGIGAVMLYTNQKSADKSDFEILITNLKRGLFLIFLTLPVNILSLLIFSSGNIWEWNIFQLIGVSMIGTVFFGKFRSFSIFITFSMVLTLWKLLSTDSFFTNGHFPIIPWLNYYLIGCWIGCILIASNKHKKIRDLIQIVGVGLLCAVLFLFITNANILKSILQYNFRIEIMPMLIITIVFLGVFSFFEFLSNQKYASTNWLNYFGYVPLSIYYLHLLYQYSLFFFLKKLHYDLNRWGVLHWIILNLLFWGLTHTFITKYWREKKFILGIEWFISKYISKKSRL